jgi:hypothetical protein
MGVGAPGFKLAPPLGGLGAFRHYSGTVLRLGRVGARFGLPGKIGGISLLLTGEA